MFGTLSDYDNKGSPLGGRGARDLGDRVAREEARERLGYLNTTLTNIARSTNNIKDAPSVYINLFDGRDIIMPKKKKQKLEARRPAKDEDAERPKRKPKLTSID